MRPLAVRCPQYRHKVILNVDHLAGDLTIPSFGPRMACAKVRYLTVRRYLRVTSDHGSILLLYSALEKPYRIKGPSTWTNQATLVTGRRFLKKIAIASIATAQNEVCCCFKF